MAFEKARICVDRGGGYNSKDDIKVLFNPKEYSIGGSINYDADNQQHLGKTPATFNLALFFDTYEKGESVRKETNKILQLMEPNKDGIPPMCKFVWGDFSFEGLIKSIDQKFTMFLENGTPVRAELNVVFIQSAKVMPENVESRTKDVKVEGGDISFDELDDKYFSFFSPTFNIKVDGKNLKSEGMLIKSVTVDTHTEKADSFSFSVFNSYDEKKKNIKWIENILVPGKDVVINLGYGTSVETVFKGFITSVEFNFEGEKNVELYISGMDASFKMMKGVKSKSWTKKKHSDIAKEIASGYQLDCEVDDTQIILEIIEQSRVSDYQFLKWMADKNNLEFFITGKKMYFRKPYKNKSPVISLKWGKMFKRLSIEHDIGDQIGNIIVRGWDEKKKEEIAASSKAVSKLNSKGITGQSIIKSLISKSSDEYIYTGTTSKEFAEKLATATLNQRAMKLVNGQAETIGIPEIRAGRYAQISGIGDKLNKLYYIVSAKHIIDEKKFVTEFVLGGNSI